MAREARGAGRLGGLGAFPVEMDIAIRLFALWATVRLVQNACLRPQHVCEQTSLVSLQRKPLMERTFWSLEQVDLGLTCY